MRGMLAAGKIVRAPGSRAKRQSQRGKAHDERARRTGRAVSEASAPFASATPPATQRAFFDTFGPEAYLEATQTKASGQFLALDQAVSDWVMPGNGTGKDLDREAKEKTKD